MSNIVHANAWDTNDTQVFIGLGLGRDEIFKYNLVNNEGSRQVGFDTEDVVRTFDFSPVMADLVAYGHRSGVFTLRKFGESPMHIFKPEISRKCNTITFSTNGLVATGYDKHKQIDSLLVYDAGSLSKEPLVSTCSMDPVYTAKFVNSMPHSLIYGTGRAIREYDTRSGSTVYSLSTNLSTGIKSNLFDNNIFASCGGVGSVGIWDRRMLNNSTHAVNPGSNANSTVADPLLVIPRALPDAEASFRFSNSSPNEIGCLHSNAHIRRYKLSRTTELYSENDSYFVEKVFDVKTNTDKVTAFDYATDVNNDELMFVCIRQSGTVFTMPVSEPLSNIYFDPSNNFKSLKLPQKLVEIGPHMTSTDLATLDSVFQSDSSAEESVNESESESESDGESIKKVQRPNEDRKSISRLLQSDINSVMQHRALAGYSLTPDHNAGLVEQSPSLKAAWNYISKQLSFDYLSDNEVDLRFAGVIGVWRGLSADSLKLRCKDGKSSGKAVDLAVKQAVRKAGRLVYTYVEDDAFLYRQLCLRLCGWDFGLPELESKLLELEERKQFEKAAGWALFHNNVGRAVESLAKSRRKSHRLMATAVSGYHMYKNVSNNNIWREQCRRLASEAGTPYLRAIFAFVADGSWLDVVDDPSLPLTERLGIALRFLPKKEVSKFLSSLQTRALNSGDLESLVLTGMAPQTVKLFQTYADRSGDVQTVALLACYGFPQYFTDTIVDQWLTEYRLLLNAWQYYPQRAKLDIRRNKLRTELHKENRAFRGTINSESTQAFLRCSYCHKLVNSLPLGSNGVWNKCPHCNYALPPCGVCAMQLGPCLDDKEESDRWPTFCLNCNHGFHSVHARQWFKRYNACPVQNCTCLCGLTFI